MNFSVGYQFFDDDRLVSAVLENKSRINEVYFAFGDIPNGRNTKIFSNMSEKESRQLQLSHLKTLSDNGIRLNFLLNANCYGEQALARDFYEKIGDTLDFLASAAAVDSVTTTSPIIAKFIKQNFENIKTRASVNMEIGTVEGLDYLAEWFDGFYLKREYNHDIDKLRAARKWCDENGKQLFGLANSGCLNYCSAHAFHDNLVAHEAEIAQKDNAYQFEGQCWQYLKQDAKREEWLRLTNFIRPEDTALYDGLYDLLKLATRVSKNPLKIIRAYSCGGYSGNLPELLEPNHAGLFYPQIIENKKLPENFASKLLECDKNCAECGFCKAAQRQATITF